MVEKTLMRNNQFFKIYTKEKTFETLKKKVTEKIQNF